jgi:hypothetical protein
MKTKYILLNEAKLFTKFVPINLAIWLLLYNSIVLFISSIHAEL